MASFASSDEIREMADTKVSILPHLQMTTIGRLQANEFARRSKAPATATKYPISDPEELRIIQGDVLLHRIHYNPTHQPSGVSTNNSTPNIHVFSTFNGMDPENPGDDFVFAGIAATNCPYSERYPNDLTTVLAGQASINLLGEKFFPDGSLAVAKWPAKAYQGNAIVPKYQIEGHGNRFYANIEPYEFHVQADVFDEVKDTILRHALQIGKHHLKDMTIDDIQKLSFEDSTDFLIKFRKDQVSVAALEAKIRSGSFDITKYSFFQGPAHDRASLCPVRKYVNLILAFCGANVNPDSFRFTQSAVLDEFLENARLAKRAPGPRGINVFSPFDEVPQLIAEQARLYENRKIGKVSGSSSGLTRGQIILGFIR